MSAAIPYLDATLVERLLQPQALLNKLAMALQEFSRRSGGVIQPVRTTVPVAQHRGFMGVMPGLLCAEGEETLGLKVVTWYAEVPPPAHSHHAVITLFDPPTGAPLVIMDGSVITAHRTAAASALATDLLAAKESRVLALIGAGVQARSHARYLSLVREFREIRVWSRHPEHAAACVADIRAAKTPHGGEVPVEVSVASSVEAAVRDADVVCTLSGATQPICLGRWLKPGAHVNAVGACRPDQRELDDELTLNATVVVDSVEGARSEAGDILLCNADIAGELGQFLARPPSLPLPTRFSVFKSLGMAVEDLAAAQLVLRQYQASERSSG